MTGKHKQPILQDQTDLLATVFESSPNIMMLVNGEGYVEKINRMGSEFAGSTPKDLVGLLAGEVFHCVNLSGCKSCGDNPLCAECPIRGRLARSMQEGASVLNEEGRLLVRKGGTVEPMDFLISTVPVKEADKTKVLVTIVDITERKRAEQALLESEERYRQAVENSPNPIFSIDGEGMIQTWNQACEKTFQYGQDIVGNPFYILLRTTEDAVTVKTMLETVSRGQSLSDIDMVYCSQDGSERSMVSRIYPLHNQEGEVQGYVFANTDITERKRSELSLQEREAKLQSIFRSAPIGIGMVIDRVIQEANPTLCQMTGYAREELLGNSARMLYPSEKEYEFVGVEKYRQIELHHKGTVETRWQRKDGTIRDILLSSVPLDPSDLLKGVTFSALDITEWKEAQQALEESKDLLRESQRIARTGHYALDTHSGLWQSSEALDELFGIGPDHRSDVEGWLQIVHPDDREAMAAYFANEVLKKHQDFDREYRIVRLTDGETRWVHGLGRLEFSTNGSPVRMIGNIQDITERKEAEITLRESAVRYRAVVENQTEFIVRWKPDGTRTFANEAYLRYFDLSFEEALTHDFLPLVLEQDRVLVEGKISRLLAGETNSETDVHRVIKPDGSIGWQEWTDNAIYNGQGELVEFLSVGRDITARKLADEALRTKTEELEALFSISSHLRAAQTADDMLPVVLAEMRRVLHSDANAVIMLDPDHQHFKYAYSDGKLAAFQGLKFDVAQSISGLVLQNRQPYISEDISSDHRKARALQEIKDLGPAIVVPVTSEAESLGVLLSARNKGDETKPYSASEVRLLTAVGEMVGNALRRARLFDQALKRMQYLQTLHSIDIAISTNLNLSVILEVLLTQGLAQLDVDAACVLLLEPYTHMLEYAASKGIRSKEIKFARLRLGEGLAGKAVIERKTLFLPNLLEVDHIVRKYLLEEGFVSYQAVPLIAKGQLQGVLEIFNRKPIDGGEEQTGFLETLATQAAIAIDNSHLFSDLQRSNFELEMAYDATIEGWSRALELRDQETEGHTLRVTEMTMRLAQEIGVRSANLIHIRRGALLHDIGKMGVPDRILLKPGSLTGEEWEIMKQHTVYAFEMLWPIEFLRPAIDIPRYHHERWDGTGYPQQLKGEHIPLSARLFAVADVWDALTSDRPYRKAWTEAKALDYIIKNNGKHFDPHVIELFLDLRGRNDRAVDFK